jgi:glycosyltransferase involved in cell wall biosynthesis
MPVKNDSWILNKSLRAACSFADHVMVFDDDSDDETQCIYKSMLAEFSNVTLIHRPRLDFDGPALRNFMLSHARKHDGENIIIELHADEILSSRVLLSDSREAFKSAFASCDSIEMPWLTIWGSPNTIRDDQSVWSKNHCVFAFRDDRQCEFLGPAFHGARVPDGLLKRRRRLIDYPVLHYQFLNRNYEESKQCLYHMYEKLHHPDKPDYVINRVYACSHDRRSIRLKNIQTEHIHGWADVGVDLLHWESFPEDNWRDSWILGKFNEYGVKHFKCLNIWGIDWAEKDMRLGNGTGRESASRQTSVYDPRDIVERFNQWFINRFQMLPPWSFKTFEAYLYLFLIRLKKWFS